MGKLVVLLFLMVLSSSTTHSIFRNHVCLLWDRALIPQVVKETFRSLARSYTHPFLLIMSNYWWKTRTIPLISKVFRDVQVISVSQNYSFRGGKGAGDRLIMAIVGTPILEDIASLPALDEACVSVIDVLDNRFDTHEKQRSEIERIRKRCCTPLKRLRSKPDRLKPS